MRANPSLFQFEQADRTLILSPTRNLSELELVGLDDTFHDIIGRLESNRVMNVVIDFGATDYYGSMALGMLITLWKRVRRAGGQLVLCNLSNHEREILELTHLDHLWTICPTRDEAMEQVS